MSRVAVIGGGISGLAAAHHLLELEPTCEVALFESAERVGGVLETQHRDGYLLELSADNFITTSSAAQELCAKLGVELVATNEGSRRAMVVCRGKLEPVPAGFMLMQPRKIGPLMQSPILSWPAKLRVLGEYFVPRAERTDESLASFARRRLGQETFERLVQPLVGGIYTADPELLSLRATLPRFLEMERKHGSLIRAALADPKPRKGATTADAGVRYSKFVAPKHGMGALVDALAASLPAGTIRTKTGVASLSPEAEGGWRVVTACAEDDERFDSVVVAIPTFRAANLVREFDEPLATELEAIPYASAAVAMLGYRRDQIAHPLNSFGFVVPAIENRKILAASFSSNKFAERAPDDRMLIRVFLGGAMQNELLQRDDAALLAIAEEELADLLGITGAPELAELARWPRAMPQYHVGHLDRVERIEKLAGAWPRLALAGNGYRGVGIPHCIQSGQRAAAQVLSAIVRVT